ncbi:16S rRNA (cytidine(1402)-2'-O)-methyltransferase [Deinococcus yavapaiensis]|uniref:Ribosomal RNA small subunit methyltransferase I n=1 Tax=Deinococcus yavapaiensis KR-236 TaxID=694435 RepID=A0A318S4F2_9DEIO|nr:16S rRNA (cytidine(1402)-2'-O)-methyltransferase [Deinococcus yavapaiensis]PYE51850.1 16S rRNA (cytidine1402-2'-O)-methyltransferase [Deinococcus yavapaiensis KR-236]
MTAPHVTLVPTPIGNLSDITLRAIEVLKGADAVACEDTRHSGALLHHLGIKKPLVRLDAHTIRDRAGGVLEKYPRLAYVSDAGTPGISDPGAELVEIVLDLGGTVEALPGPTAFVPALVLSGLKIARFTFEGFLPRSGRERRERLAALARREEASVVYESPHRLAETLADLAEACGGARRASVTRELSKLHEETRRGSLSELSALFEQGARGEIVVVVEGRSEPLHEEAVDFEAMARLLADEGRSAREIRALLTQAGLRKNDAYALSLRVTELREQPEE